MKREIHLDNHQFSRPFPKVADRMAFAHKEAWSSPQKNQEPLSLANSSLQILYKELGAHEEDKFIFTPGGAAATNQVFLSTYLDGVRQTGRNHFITTKMEEKPVLLSIKRLEQFGCTGKSASLNSQGLLTRSALEEAITPRTSLVSLSWANGLTGVIHPIHDLAEVCREKGVALHVDASAVIGKLFFRFQDLPIDFLSFEGRKVHAPFGTGGLFIKKDSSLSPLILGESQCNVGGLCALATAVETLSSYFDHLCTETARLRDKLEKGIEQGIPDSCVFFKDVERLPHCSAMAFPSVGNEALLFVLHRQGVYASIGGGDAPLLSEILQACGVESDLTHSAISFTLSYETTEEEIDRAIEIIVESVKKMRTFSSSMREDSL